MDVIATVVEEELGNDALIVTNLGRTADEWRAAHKPRTDDTLYSMGMGLVTPVALGLAVSLPHKPVIALDGDGSMLMGLGTLPTLANAAGSNLLVVVFDNETYASTGPQPTATRGVTDLALMATAAGCAFAETVDNIAALEQALALALSARGPSVIVAKVAVGSSEFGPKMFDGRENKYRFVRAIEESENTIVLRPTSVREPADSGDVSESNGTPEVVGSDHARSDLRDVVLEGMARAGIDFVATLPASQLSSIQEACSTGPEMVHVAVANECEGAAICAGAWLAGRRPALIIESSGLLVAAYALARCNGAFGIPITIISTYRGDVGETEWYATPSGRATEPLLDALGIQKVVVRERGAIVSAIRNAQATANSSLSSCAVILGGNLTRKKRQRR